MSKKLLIKNGTVVTLGENNRVLEDHAILCEGDKIARIAPTKDLAGEKADEVIDAKNQVVMPGFINSHMHFYSTLVRGLGKAKPSKDFGEVLENLWWRLDRKLTVEDSYISAMIPLVDAVRKGTTTLIDHHASPFAARGSLNRIADAVKEVGLRASLCYELSDRDGEKIAQDGIDENVEFLKRCQKENDPQLRALFGLHASFTINDKTLEKAVAAGKALGAGFHVHTAEAKSDQDYNEKHFKMRVVERFKKFGILGPKTITAHCVHLSDREFDLLKETDTVVVHNPQSNMNNAVGVADVVKMTEKGILVGLGTDAMTVNMMEELRAALWVRHLAANNPSVGFCETLNTLLVNNSKIATRQWGFGVGELKEGFVADIITMPYAPPTQFDGSTFLGHFACGLAGGHVDTTIAGGRVLMKNRELKINVDEQRIAARARELSKTLWERF
jgi:putative selenium metabolism protein SsnA